MSLPPLVLGSVTLPRYSARAIQQQDINEKSVAQHRTGPNGTLRKQTLWRKKAFRISGQGFVPLALAGFDWESSFTMSAIKPSMAKSATVVVTLPAARRTDVTNLGFALVGGIMVPTTFSILGNDATLVAVSGASGYFLQYYPTYSVKAEPPEDSFDEEEGGFVWSMDVKEV